MHIIVGVVDKVSVPEVDCIFARQVVGHAQHLCRNLLASDLATTLAIGKQGNCLFLH